MAVQVVQAVQAVHLESDAFLVCLNHALSTEKEEVMGLCVGEVDTVRIVHVHSVIILRRSDKRKDRVEISPEQLSAASTEAERCPAEPHAQKSSEYEIIEIPVHIVPHVSIGKVCLESAVELPKILCQEEQDAYRMIHSLTHLDSVTKIHNGSVFTKNLCSQMSAVSGPLLQWFEDRLEQNQQHLQELQQEKEELLQELASLD
ncbi:lys-63-specific deubiquitinase BRCC36 [Octodon degus]|uniref:Lys-63-specific deubiquitinase BRCC36 n=1 Tax=Octodon degus TaxID=10160 RepID=A0A6P6DID2_OCTDE|nr:lys-63-specific deubiquitinase BRCC36 [Octodon degus]